MRVASNTIYSLTNSRIGRITDELMHINTMATTGKKINNLQDDPVGMTRVISLKSNVTNLDQLEKNIATGRTWLEAGEQSLSTVVDLISDAKDLAISMNNGIISDIDRESGALEISGIIDQVIGLSNTTVQGQYIYSGTKTDAKAYSLETSGGITRAVYGGNDTPFKVKIAASTDIEVGQTGSDIFRNQNITIDETNNKIDFMEDPAGGSGFYGAQLTVTIPNGEYSPDELAVAVEAAMTARSAATGQPEIVEVTQNNATFIVDDYSALSVPTGGTNIDLTYVGATNTWVVSDDPGYPNGISPVALESDASRVILDFTGDGEGDVTVNFDSAVPNAYSVSFDITAAGGNAVDYDVSYNSLTEKYTILENGGPALTDLKMMWATGSNKDEGLGVDMGFDTTSDDIGAADGTNHVSDNEAEWGIFRTLIDLEAYLKDNDTEGINRSIARLAADFDHVGSYISQSGIKQKRLDIRENIITDLKLSYETNRMDIEDADVIETFSRLQQKQFAYQAALNSTAKILGMSLLDYM